MRNHSGHRCFRWQWLVPAMGWLVGLASLASASPRPACTKVVFEGEVSAGREWSASLGGGWVFRILPVQPSGAGYSGWDLVVDRDPPSGYPDALLLATMPYNSINEREIGTTFGLRAQDAIGWNPRSFRFLADPVAFREGQQLFRSQWGSGGPGSASAGSKDAGSPETLALARLLALQKGAIAGELHILDAHIIPGVSDPAPYARQWALASARTPHQIDAALQARESALGALNSLRFAITLWLPVRWKTPAGIHAAPAACEN